MRIPPVPAGMAVLSVGLDSLGVGPGVYLGIDPGVYPASLGVGPEEIEPRDRLTRATG